MTVNASIQNLEYAEGKGFNTFSTIDFTDGRGGRVSVFLHGENHNTVAVCIAEYLNDHLQASKPQPPEDPDAEDPDFDDPF